MMAASMDIYRHHGILKGFYPYIQHDISFLVRRDGSKVGKWQEYPNGSNIMSYPSWSVSSLFEIRVGILPRDCRLQRKQIPDCI